MLVFMVRRSLQALLVLFVMSVLVFIGASAIDSPAPILINPQADQPQQAYPPSALNLEGPLWLQYLGFVSGAVHGDLGDSVVHHTPALGLVLERMPATLELTGVAMLIAIVLGVPLGLWAGLKPDSAAGRTILAGSMLGISLPTFWVGILLLMLFSGLLGWLPSTGRGPTTLLFGVPVSFLSLQGWRHLILPAMNLALFKLALLARVTHADTRAVVQQDYVKFARAKGLTQTRVIGVHVLRNVMLPLAPAVGPAFGSIIAFAIVTETVFGWPGMGKLLIDSLSLLDRPTILAYLVVMVMLLIGINWLVDVVGAALDPRVRLPQARE